MTASIDPIAIAVSVVRVLDALGIIASSAVALLQATP